MKDIPVYDNHVHMNPLGGNIETLKEFEKAGGTGITLVTLPYSGVSDPGDLLRSYEVTISMAARARECTGLEINVAVGPYPVLLLPLAEHLGIEKAENVMKAGMKMAADLVASGRADAIGEIGRPHFSVPDDISEASDRILAHGMELASANCCPVIIHSESGSPEMMRELSDMARSSSLDPGMVIKHFSPPLVHSGENHGLMPSIPASRKAIREALEKGDRFMLETDHIDDPKRPGAVMPITTVPKRILGMMSSGELSEETAWKIGRDIPERMFGQGKH